MNELTIKEKKRILRDVSLGAQAPEHESEEARHWRIVMEHQVKKASDQGLGSEIPFDPEADAPASLPLAQKRLP